MTDLIEKRPNFYGFGGLDRSAHIREREGWLDELLARPDTRLVLVWRTRSFVIEVADAAPRAAILQAAEHRHLVTHAESIAFLGEMGGIAHVALDLSPLDEVDIPGILQTPGAFTDLRRIGPLLERFEGSLLAYARGLLWWHQRHRFCGVCGHPTKIVKGGHQRSCTSESCRAPHFPRTDPAVIMLVHDGERCLLGRQRIWPDGMYSTLAGFVEPGETLEEAVAREVWEESGIHVRKVQYHSSQPWPFPSSLMLGFHAEAKSFDIVRNDEELGDAQWYTAEDLAAFESRGNFLPRRDSIARRLVQDWVESVRPDLAEAVDRVASAYPVRTT
ncbi:NUDIX hydrolase [alpha proteobacterium BAL199]|nr:NUDIX hydrolase [alpha proteobacterium BAL199]